MPPSLLVAVSALLDSAGGQACWVRRRQGLRTLSPRGSCFRRRGRSTPSMNAVLEVTHGLVG